MDGGDWSFVEQWASSVESLTITMSRFATNDLPSLDHAHFPRLRMLRLTGYFGDSVALLAALNSSPLSSLSLNLTSVPSNAKSRLEKLPQLITIPSTTLSLPKSSPPGLVALFKSFCEHHHLMLRYHGRSPLATTLKSSCDPSFAPRDARREETDQLCDAWDEVLEFGRSLERVRLDGDLEGAVEMRQRLDELVERMELARD